MSDNHSSEEEPQYPRGPVQRYKYMIDLLKTCTAKDTIHTILILRYREQRYGLSSGEERLLTRAEEQLSRIKGTPTVD
jgi:hypothetical protein